MSRDWTSLLWSEMTWGERAQAAACFVAASVFGVGMFLGAIVVLGMMIDAASHRQEQHDRCLRKATNGYEIKQCR